MTYEGMPLLAVQKGINASIAADIFVPIPCGDKRIVPRYVWFTNASASLALTTTAVGIYTGAGATGTAIVTASTANLTPLVASTDLVDTVFSPVAAIALSAAVDGSHGSGLYINIGGTPTVNATFDVYIGGHVLT